MVVVDALIASIESHSKIGALVSISKFHMVMTRIICPIFSTNISLLSIHMPFISHAYILKNPKNLNIVGKPLKI